MRNSISDKILLPLFLAVAGGFIAYGAYYWFLVKTRTDSTFIEIAAMQAVRAEQIGRLSYTLAVGFEWAREPLAAAVERFEVDLTRLEEGDEELPLNPAPAELSSEMTSVRESWESLRALALRIQELPAEDEASEAAYEEMRPLLPALNEATQELIRASRDRTERLRRRTSWTLAIICMIDVLLMAIAFRMIRSMVVRPLQSLERAARRVKEGDFTEPVSATADDEIGQVGSAFNEMASSLQNLIQRQAQARDSLRRLSGRLMKAQDDERRRLAREIHDSTVQALAVASMRLADLQEGTDPEELQKTRALIDNAANELRSTSYLLHPPILERLGLAAALEEYISEFSNRSDLEISLDVSDVGRLPREIEFALFRIVQECLWNIQRHADSHQATVRITKSDEWVELEVADRGRGIEPEELEAILEGRRGGVGISGMRERVLLLDGEFDLDSDAHGTRVMVKLPIGEGDRETGEK